MDFDCRRHEKFKVAGSVFTNPRTKDASPEQWERALKNANAKAPGAWAPCIQTYDF